MKYQTFQCFYRTVARGNYPTVFTGRAQVIRVPLLYTGHQSTHENTSVHLSTSSLSYHTCAPQFPLQETIPKILRLTATARLSKISVKHEKCNQSTKCLLLILHCADADRPLKRKVKSGKRCAMISSWQITSVCYETNSQCGSLVSTDGLSSSGAARLCVHRTQQRPLTANR